MASRPTDRAVRASTTSRGASTTSRDEQTTDPEARAAVKRVLLELFDLPAVVRGRKPVSELAGLTPLFWFFALQFVEMGISTVRQNNSRKLVGVMYLRDTRMFVWSIAQQAALSLLYQCNRGLNWWVRTRIDLAWRKQLTEKLHAIYFADAVFYRQTGDHTIILHHTHAPQLDFQGRP